MPLTQAQRDALRKQLAPLVKEALTSELTPTIQAEVKRVLEEGREDAESYSHKILSSKDVAKLRQGNDLGVGVARLARCLALNNGDVERAARFAENTYDDDLGSAIVKTLNSGDADEGGVFVPSVLASTFIDALRARAVVRQAGPVEIDLSGGNLMVPRIVTDATAGWVGEGKKRNASNLGTGDLNFVAKTLQGKTPITQQLLRRSGQNAENIMRDNLIKVMANEEDSALLRGTGTAAKPKGMTQWAIAANVINATQAGASATLSEIQTDTRKLIAALDDNNVDTATAAWFFSKRSKNYMAYNVRDTEDRPIFQNELTAASPSLLGYPAFPTNNVPNNLGGGNNESEVIFAAMADAWLADEMGLRIRASSEASFTDSQGNLVSAFDKGLMVIIIERDLDFAMTHGESVAVLDTVKWGA